MTNFLVKISSPPSDGNQLRSRYRWLQDVWRWKRKEMNEWVHNCFKELDPVAWGIADTTLHPIYQWNSFPSFTIEKILFGCRKQNGIALFLLNFVLWLVYKTRVTVSTNQMQNQHQSRLGRPRFPLFACLFFFFPFEYSLALQGIFLSSDGPFW